MPRHVIIIFALMIAASGPVSAATERLTPRDIAGLKAVCRELLGSQFPYDDLQRSQPWRRLLPYLRSKDEFYRGKLVCSARCSGSIALRGGLWLDFGFINPQKFNEHWGPKDGLIDSITLWDGHKVLLRYPKA